MKAMEFTDDEANEAARFSWCYQTTTVDWEQIAERIRAML